MQPAIALKFELLCETLRLTLRLFIEIFVLYTQPDTIATPSDPLPIDIVEFIVEFNIYRDETFVSPIMTPSLSYVQKAIVAYKKY